MNTNQLQEEYNALAHKIAIKHKRNLILGETDKYVLCYFPLTPEQLEQVKTYRQQLRDFIQNNYVLPDKPDFVITMN